jgi:hypothetical protein
MNQDGHFQLLRRGDPKPDIDPLHRRATHCPHSRVARISMQEGESQRAAPSSSGIVDSECSAANMINACGSFVRDLCEATFGVAPTIQLEGMTDAKFKCVTVSHNRLKVDI